MLTAQGNSTDSPIPQSLLYIVPSTIIGLQICMLLLRATHWKVLKQLCSCKQCAPAKHVTIFSVLEKYEQCKQAQQTTMISDKKSYHTIDTLRNEAKNKMFFNCWELLFEYTFLEECKDTEARINLGKYYVKMARWVKMGTLKTLVFSMVYLTPYVFPLEWMAFRLRDTYDDNTAVVACTQLLIVILGFLRLFTQLFLVSLMSSRHELLRIGLEGFDDLKWVYKLLKFHYYRSLYLTILFELLKNLAGWFLIGKTDDYLCVSNAGYVKLNLVITSVYILRYCMLLSVIDVQRSRRRDVVDNDDLVYKEQKKLWYILNFLPRYLPDEKEVARIVTNHPDDFQLVESELRAEFKKAYELFSTQIEVMKKQNCKSINNSQTSTGFPFSLAIIYFISQGIAWIAIYIGVLNSIGVQYEMSVDNSVYIPALIFYFIEMVMFPSIFLRMIKIDVLLDRKSADELINGQFISRRRFKGSQDLTEGDHLRRQSTFE